MAFLRRVQADAVEQVSERQRFSQRRQRARFAQMTEEADDKARGDTVLAFSVPQARGDALEHGLHRHATRGVRLRVAEDLRVHDPVRMGAFQVRKGQGLEIVRISQDRGAFVIDVEKRLQIAEVVRLAQRLYRGELEPHAMLLRQGEEHLRLEAALDVKVQLGLGQATDERFQRHFPGTLPSTPSTYQLIASTSLSVSVLPS